jgi:hypothetical protein
MGSLTVRSPHFAFHILELSKRINDKNHFKTN